MSESFNFRNLYNPSQISLILENYNRIFANEGVALIVRVGGVSNASTENGMFLDISNPDIASPEGT